MKYNKLTKKKAYHQVKKQVPTNEEIIKLKELFNKDNIYSIDECYFSEKILPNYGYCIKGQRLNTQTKPKNWKKRSLLMAISKNGNYIYRIINGSINSIIFKEFCDLLQNNNLIMDNVSFHKKYKDNRYNFIPCYSPEYNPIEYIFSKIKNSFRKLNFLNTNIEKSISESINNINKDDIINCFSHVNKLLNNI